MSDQSELRAFQVEAFKSYGKAELRLSPLTLLIGPNASGKSNLIEGLRLLSWLARGQRLDQVFRSVEDGDLAVRGGVQDMALNGHDTFSLGCSFRAPDWTEFCATIRVTGSDLRVTEESVDSLLHVQSYAPLYRIEAPTGGLSHDIEVAYNNFAPGGVKPRITCTDQQLVLTQLGTPARFWDTHEESQRVIPRVTKAFCDALGRILFLDPAPRRMRGYTHRLDSALKGDGANLSSALHSICQTPDGRDAVLEFIRDLPEQDIRGIGFIETERGDVMVRLTESFADREQERDAPILSDGTLRVLAVAAAVLSAPEGSMVVIEEIDSGVHPSRAEALLANILRVAKERSLKVLLTSHNPALADALPTEAIPHVAYCYRDPQDGTSRIVHLGDLSRYPALIAQGTVGRLMTKGTLEKALKDTRTPEERQEEALAWIHEQWKVGE